MQFTSPQKQAAAWAAIAGGHIYIASNTLHGDAGDDRSAVNAAGGVAHGREHAPVRDGRNCRPT